MKKLETYLDDQTLNDKDDNLDCIEGTVFDIDKQFNSENFRFGHTKHTRGCLMPNWFSSENIIIYSSIHIPKLLHSKFGLNPPSNKLANAGKPSQPVTHSVFQLDLSISTCERYHNPLILVYQHVNCAIIP